MPLSNFLSGQTVAAPNCTELPRPTPTLHSMTSNQFATWSTVRRSSAQQKLPHGRGHYRAHRHLLRFPMERHDFTAIAPKEPSAEATAPQTWIDGRPGETFDIAGTASP